jgi:hypothetical protein
MKDSFVFYRSFYESTKGLPNESRLRIFDNICELALNDEDIDGLQGIEINIFTLIRPQIEANNQRYENGKKGGRPKKKTIGYEIGKTTGYENKKPNVNVNVNVNDNIKKENIIKEKRFSKPTIEEVESYCKERNNNVDPHRFINYYEANGWVQGKARKPIKDWKACIRTWERENQEENLPEWFNQKIEKKEISEEEQEELDNLLNNF